MNRQQIAELFAIADEASAFAGRFSVSPGRMSAEDYKRGQKLGVAIEDFLDKHGLKTDRDGVLVFEDYEPEEVEPVVVEKVARRSSKKRAEEVAELARKTLADSADAIGDAVAEMIKKIGV